MVNLPKQMWIRNFRSPENQQLIVNKLKQTLQKYGAEDKKIPVSVLANLSKEELLQAIPELTNYFVTIFTNGHEADELYIMLPIEIVYTIADALLTKYPNYSVTSLPAGLLEVLYLDQSEPYLNKLTDKYSDDSEY